MKYLPRILESTVMKYLNLFPVVGITGPRQSGKSTMLKHIFGSEYKYITFDDPLTIQFFEDDPKGFLAKYSNRVIFDEIQKVPALFSYIKIAVDSDRQNYGKFIVTGSSQFSLIREITETLAGRIGLLSLLPFQCNEIPERLRDLQILKGSYPELVTRNFNDVSEWYAAYIVNYIERDVRSLYNIGNLRDFQRLIMLLAARTAQELNVSAFANEVGVTVKTIQRWISILEASYIIYLLPPYYKNLGKRITKRPKLYFFDTGLVCFLTGLRDAEVLERGPLVGPVFENYIVSEIYKKILHKGADVKLYYFRDNLGVEADLIMEDRERREIRFIEVKTTSTAKIKMIEPLEKLIQYENISGQILPVKVTGYLVFKGVAEDAFKNNIFIKNYKAFLEDLDSM
ncbi:MAG: ATP-binding protein [Spirochaetota bacterium]